MLIFGQAIYPMLIIVLVSLNDSPLECASGFSIVSGSKSPGHVESEIAFNRPHSGALTSFPDVANKVSRDPKDMSVEANISSVQ